jgi:hypothetical protein
VQVQPRLGRYGWAEFDALRVAFSLGTFFWRSKRKYLDGCNVADSFAHFRASFLHCGTREIDAKQPAKLGCF